MKHTAMVVTLFYGLAAPALADLTIKQNSTGKGLGFSGQMSGSTYIKGSRMRADAVNGGKTLTTIFDLDAQKVFVLDSKKKEADVWDMSTFLGDVAKSVDASKMEVSLSPTGEAKEIAGQKADGYMLEISMPAAIAGSPDLAMLVTLSGPMWVVKGAPGTADYLGFYKAAADKGWILSDPRAAKGAPGQARVMTEMYRQLAELGGIPYETNQQIKMSATGGGNPLGALLARAGEVSYTTTVLSVDTSELADDLFAPPADYKLNAKK
jgi:hypothetical protein